MILLMDAGLLYSVILSTIGSVPVMYFEIILVTSVLPTPDGPTNKKVSGLFFSSFVAVYL